MRYLAEIGEAPAPPHAADILRYRAFGDAAYNINSLAKTIRVRDQMGNFARTVRRNVLLWLPATLCIEPRE